MCVISWADAGALLVAGAAAGVVGTAGGITSLISYPALLAVGLGPLSANIANLVALVCCWPGSALASGPELAGRGRWLARWMPLAAAGSAAGVALLLCTPAGVFAGVVPFLVLAGAVTLLVQPWLTARSAAGGEDGGAVFRGGLVAISVYSGYFGAGAGVMALSLMLHTADRHLARANALKNMLMGPTTAIAAAALAVFGTVDWAAAAPLGAGMFAGAVAGPVVARRLPERLLRVLVAALGLALAVELWVNR